MSKNWLKPKWETGFILTKIVPKVLLEKGIKALMIDVDGTLIPGNKLILDKSVLEWIKDAKRYLKLYIISNNPSKERVKSIAGQLDLNFIYAAQKPRRASLLKIIEKLKIEKSTIGIVGDRIFTDVLAGNRIGIYTILVKPMGDKGEVAKNSSFQNLEIVIANLIKKIIP